MSNFKDMARKPGQVNGAAVAPLSESAELDAKLYGSLGELSAGKIVAKPIEIGSIRPDPRQPRRQIPSALRAAWDGEPGSLFRQWILAHANEVGKREDAATGFLFDRLYGVQTEMDAVYQDEAVRGPTEMSSGVYTKSLLAVVDLAAQIRAEGLINPIRVVNAADGYLIESGERRWLAFQLLHWFTGDEGWSKIPAVVAPQFSAWQQARENTARSSLNAIGMARQLALLLMDLYAAEGVTFLPFDDMVPPGGCDRAYYAQVADGQTWRVPRGQGEALVGALGLKNPVQIRQYRALLSVSDTLWQVADDLDWPEQRIRQIIEATLNPRHQAQMTALHAEKEGYTVTVVTVSDADEGQEWSDGAMLDAAAEEQFRNALTPLAPSPSAEDGYGEGEQMWDGVAVDEDGVAFDAWTDTPLGQEPHHPAAGASPSHQNAGEGENSQVWENPWDDPAMNQKRLNLMSYAFSRARGNYFRPADVGISFELLTALVERGELESQSPTFNKQDRSLWKFRITPKGCGVLGRIYGQWDDPQQPISRPPATYGTLPQPTVAPAKKRGGSIISKPLANLFIGLQAVDKLEADGDYDAVCQIDDQFAEFEALIAQARAPFLARRARGE